MRKPKEVSAAVAVKAIKSGDDVVLANFCAEPPNLAAALMDRAHELKNVRTFHLTPMGPFQEKYLLQDMCKKVRCTTAFSGRRKSMRTLMSQGRADFYPLSFEQIPEFLRTGDFKSDVFMTIVSPPDKFGYCSLGVSVDYAWGAIERPARVIIAEVNPNMPRTYGRTFIHISQIDYVVPTNEPLHTLEQFEITEVEEKIGRYVADIVEDGATLQVGYGGVSEAAVRFLGDKKNLGIHTEMVPEGLRPLVEAGVINNSKKAIHKGKCVCTFHGGTRALFEWVDNNPLIEMQPVDYVNKPSVIAQNSKMTAINAALQVDLYGNVYCDVLGVTDQYSGSGGQLDYVKGCAISSDAVFITTVPSISTDQKWSRIVAHPTMTDNPLAPQMPLFSRYFADVVVTENGVARLKGKNNLERAKALIAIAHPKFKEGLEKQAAAMGLLAKK